MRDVVVVNPQGIHARPAVQLASLASTFRSEIELSNVSRRAEPVDAKSTMEVILLEATCGNTIRIRAVGEDAQEAAEALAAIIDSRFPFDEPGGEAQDE